jgi:hypothetical protein
MRLSRQEAEKRYLERCPSPDTPATERLAFHFRSLHEIAWTGKGFAEQLAYSDRESARVASLIGSDIFVGLQICASAIDNLLSDEVLFRGSTEFKRCWFGVQSLLATLSDSRDFLPNDLGQRCFLLLYLSILFMRECVRRPVSTIPVLPAGLVFAAETFPLTEEEKALARSLTFPIFSGRTSFADQLNALADNLAALKSEVCKF